jgi:hypothetical protein
MNTLLGLDIPYDSQGGFTHSSDFDNNCILWFRNRQENINSYGQERDDIFCTYLIYFYNNNIEMKNIFNKIYPNPDCKVMVDEVIKLRNLKFSEKPTNLVLAIGYINDIGHIDILKFPSVYHRTSEYSAFKGMKNHFSWVRQTQVQMTVCKLVSFLTIEDVDCNTKYYMKDYLSKYKKPNFNYLDPGYECCPEVLKCYLLEPCKSYAFRYCYVQFRDYFREKYNVELDENCYNNFIKMCHVKYNPCGMHIKQAGLTRSMLLIIYVSINKITWYPISNHYMDNYLKTRSYIRPIKLEFPDEELPYNWVFLWTAVKADAKLEKMALTSRRKCKKRNLNPDTRLQTCHKTLIYSYRHYSPSSLKVCIAKKNLLTELKSSRKPIVDEDRLREIEEENKILRSKLLKERLEKFYKRQREIAESEAKLREEYRRECEEIANTGYHKTRRLRKSRRKFERGMKHLEFYKGKKICKKRTPDWKEVRDLKKRRFFRYTEYQWRCIAKARYQRWKKLIKYKLRWAKKLGSIKVEEPVFPKLEKLTRSGWESFLEKLFTKDRGPELIEHMPKIIEDSIRHNYKSAAVGSVTLRLHRKCMEVYGKAFDFEEMKLKARKLITECRNKDKSD